MDGYAICIASRPAHACELRLNAYLISPTGAQTSIYGSGNLFSDSETRMRHALKRNWPGIPVGRDDNFYVKGVDPVPETLEKHNP